MNKADLIEVGTPIPTVAAVEAMDGHTVRVTWSGGKTDVVDISPVILAFKIFRPLRRDADLFAKVAVGPFGGSITWGGDMDIGADSLERLADLQRPMPPEDFKAFMARHKMTLDSVSPALGISRRQAAYFSKGEKEIPRTVALACKGYDTVGA